MARLARLSVPDQLHLMILRAQQGLSVFADPADRRAYVDCLARAASDHRVAIHGYGMAVDELRLLATPADAQALGRMVQFIGRRFAAAFNRRHGRRGSLWDGRFRATIVEPTEYFLPCLRFVEGGPEGRQRDSQADEVPWSSADHHAGRKPDGFLVEHAQFWALGNTPFEREAAYRQAMQGPLDPDQLKGIALATHYGWLLGSPAFESAVASQVGRRLRPLSPGRPPISTRQRIEEQ
jgi:putative transposase